jgi:hypothetical protein
LNGLCLLVAGALRATLATSEFTLAWQHSVEKIRWEERYRVSGATLDLLEARIQGSGAGMDPPPEARLRNGWWTWRPATPPLRELRLTLSPYTRDYDLCWSGRCETLRSIVAVGEPTAIVTVRACVSPPRAGPA